MWYENENLKNVGMVSFGINAIDDYEVYQDKTTSELLFCYHEDPDEPVSLGEIIDMINECSGEPRYQEQMDDNRTLLRKLGIAV